MTAYLKMYAWLETVEARSLQEAVLAGIQGLSAIELMIMNALGGKDGQQATELAAAVGRAATSFTPILDKLVNKGMIERFPHSSDRRAITIRLTKQGTALLPAIETALNNTDIAYMAFLQELPMPPELPELVAMPA